MKYTIAAATIFAALGTTAIADAPAGASAMNCDPTAFVAVLTADGRVAYWNNPTCVAVGGDGTSAPRH